MSRRKFLQSLLDKSKSGGKCFSSSVAVPAPPSPLGKALKEFNKSKFEAKKEERGAFLFFI